MNTIQVDVRWRPEDSIVNCTYDKSFLGQPDAVLAEVLLHIERNYLTLTTIKHPDYAESSRFWNFSLSTIEAALRQTAANLLLLGDVCLWVDIGYHSLAIRPAEDAIKPAKSPASLPVTRVPAHPLARSPRQQDGACASA